MIVEAVQYLGALGHRRIAHVAGVGEFVHTVQRTAAFRRGDDRPRARGEIVETDYSAESGARATRKLLSSPDPPSAIVFDSDLLAVTGLGVAQQMGFARAGRPVDRRLGRLADQPGRPSAADRDHARHRGVRGRRGPASARRIDGEAPGDVETVRGELTPARQHRDRASRRRLRTLRSGVGSAEVRLTLNRISDGLHYGMHAG